MVRTKDLEPRTDILLTAHDVADILSVGVRTVWRWRKMRIIPEPIKINTSSRWRASDIQAYIDQSTKTGSPIPSRS